MISNLYQKTFSVLMKRPLRLWGITLLSSVLLVVVHIGFIGIPAVGFCALLLLEASMSMIYLNSYRTGLEPKTAYLFAAFRKDRIWRVLGGMAWMQLWIFLWSLIPIVGIVFGVIRAYEYAFVPYILMTRDDVRPTEAIKVSKAETMGYKGKLFGADLLLEGVYFVVILLLSLLSMIPYVGIVFTILRIVLTVVFGVLAPLFLGILHAAFYVEIQNRRAAAAQRPSAPVQPAPPTQSAPPAWPAPAAQPIVPVVPVPASEPQPAPAAYEPPAPAAPASEPQPAPAAYEPPTPAAPAPEPQPAEPRCPHCGAPIRMQGALFCTACGHKLDAQ